MKTPSHQTIAAENRAKELVNKRFGRLVVTGITWIQRPKSKRIGVECQCDCGQTVAIAVYSLLEQHTISCGCAVADSNREKKTTHGHASHTKPRHHLYRTWVGMRNRCNNPKTEDYPNYGGRGIKVCPEWDDFTVFAAYVMSLLPPGTNRVPKGLSIDRFPDQNGNYEPGNIRLATPTQQARNMRPNIVIEIEGVRKLLIEWCEHYGIPYHTVRSRIQRGFPVLSALTSRRYAHLNPRGQDPQTGRFLPRAEKVAPSRPA